MNIATISMPKKNAWNLFQQYHAAVRRQRSEDDVTLMRAYRALAKGSRVLNLIDAVRGAGRDQHGRPRLAICRADVRTVYCSTDTRQGWVRYAAVDFSRSNLASRHFVPLPVGTLAPYGQEWQTIRCSARVPIIPPMYRPDDALSNYHVLWEADWVAPPVDPLLLKHLGGPLYAVLAMWDLTDIERAVLAARAR